jgi:hypothetical protein
VIPSSNPQPGVRGVADEDREGASALGGPGPAGTLASAWDLWWIEWNPFMSALVP